MCYRILFYFDICLTKVKYCVTLIIPHYNQFVTGCRGAGGFVQFYFPNNAFIDRCKMSEYRRYISHIYDGDKLLQTIVHVYISVQMLQIQTIVHVYIGVQMLQIQTIVHVYIDVQMLQIQTCYIFLIARLKVFLFSPLVCSVLPSGPLFALSCLTCFHFPFVS